MLYCNIWNCANLLYYVKIWTMTLIKNVPFKFIGPCSFWKILQFWNKSFIKKKLLNLWLSKSWIHFLKSTWNQDQVIKHCLKVPKISIWGALQTLFYFYPPAWYSKLIILDNIYMYLYFCCLYCSLRYKYSLLLCVACMW